MMRGMVLKAVPLTLFFVHFALNVILGVSGWIMPFELFNLMLIAANFVIALMIYNSKCDWLMGISVMAVILSHAVIGQKIAPDSLTSGSILLVNILILYVGFKIYDRLPLKYFIVFAASYFILFFIFIKSMSNAESIFLLALMGLAATARDFKLLSYFWALVVSFSFCQPYSWQAVIILFFILKVLFSLNGKTVSPLVFVFLACGLGLVFLVLLPVIVTVVETDLRNIFNILKDSEIRNAVYLTAVTASVSTGVLGVFCIPLAYAVSRHNFFGKTLLLSMIDIPIIIPQSAAGIALLQVFSKQQFIGEILYNNFGIRFDGTVLGIILAQIFVAIPFITKSAIAAFDSVPQSLEHNARTLGSSFGGAFMRVSLPLASRGLFMGLILAWARAAGEFGAVLFISPYPPTVPIEIYNRFTSVGVVETAPLVATMILFSILIFFLLQFITSSMPHMYKKGYNL